MKFYETHFEEYTIENNRENLHPKLDKIYEKFPKEVIDLKNLIFYGPSGVGKYTQMLKSIKKYSPTKLKYEKKISVTYNKQQYFFKISDIHYEIDMSLLGCNSKLLWHEIYQQIIDIISAKKDKSGIIVCKYFHDIHSELLENFYSYMQQNNATSIDLKFILITEQISFIQDNILNCCEIINIYRPSKSSYLKCLKNKFPNKIKLENIKNIKMLHLYDENLMLQYKIICNKIINNMININDLNFLKFRDILYDIFIYNLDITECMWYILSTFIKEKKINEKNISDILIKTFGFFQYYNNNYRPIYHVEKYLFYLIKHIHNL
uniref:Replication factor C C-terminal domain-containing protein n=1 Tax=viral metagenome TaxID=1070528 RepID=A0A6C0EPR0_9ZZZZ